MRKRILIIDDDPNNVAILAEKLKPDYEVLIAEDGYEGLEKAEKELPDLIVLDVLLPGINGFEVCRKIEGNETTKNIPVIMLTSVYITDADIQAGLQLGANRITDADIQAGLQLGANRYMLKADVFMSKPCDFRELRENIDSLLGENETEDDKEDEEKIPYILIIDDDRDNAELIVIRLEALGFEVDEAVDGVDGLEKMREREPDLILLDIKMPRMTGDEVLKVVESEFPDVGVIMMTAFGNESLAVDLMKGGAIDYLPKPIDHRNIGTVVKECYQKNILRVRNNRLIAQIRESNIAQMERYEMMEQLNKKLNSVKEEKDHLIEDLRRSNDDLKRFKNVVVGRELRFGEVKKLLRSVMEYLEVHQGEPRAQQLIKKIQEELN